MKRRQRRNANAKLRFKLRGDNFGKVPRGALQKAKGAMVTPGCGCVFCDLELDTVIRDGRPSHWCNEVAGNWLACTKN